MKNKLMAIRNIGSIMLLLALGLFFFNPFCETTVLVEFEATNSISGEVLAGEDCTLDPITKVVTCEALGGVTIDVYAGDWDISDRGEGGLISTVSSGTDGTFLIENLEPGWYDIKVSAEGKSAVWLSPVYLWMNDVIVPPISLLDSVGETEFKLVLTWADEGNGNPVDLDLHLTMPSTDDPCATLDGASFGIGSCSADAPFDSVPEIIYEYPPLTDTNRLHIYPKGNLNVYWDDLATGNFMYDLDADANGLDPTGEAFAATLNGDSEANGPEILTFNTQRMAIGQYLISVVNNDEAAEATGAYDLGETGATVTLYGPDNTDGTANVMLNLQVGYNVSGSVWRIMYIDNVWEDMTATPANGVYAHPFNMYQYPIDSGYTYSDALWYFQINEGEFLIKIQ